MTDDIRKSEFVPGDHLVQCDRSGLIYRRSECRLEWTGALVAKEWWEGKHPQLEIKSVQDDQGVPYVNPDKSSTFGSTTIFENAPKGDSKITLSSVATIARGASLGITLDDRTIQWTFATEDPISDTDVFLSTSAGVFLTTSAGRELEYSRGTTTVPINEALRTTVALGNVVYVASDSEENYISLSDEERRANL